MFQTQQNIFDLLIAMTVACEFWSPKKAKKPRADVDQKKEVEKVPAPLPENCENREKLPKPTQYEKMLNLFNTRILDFQEKDALVFPGRYVIHVEKVSPLEISRQFVEPHYSLDGQCAPSARSVLRNLFGAQSLSSLLLLITPTAMEHKAEVVVHGFELDSMEHLGATIMDDAEWEQIEQKHVANSFEVVFSSGYIALEDVSEPTAMLETISDIKLQAPNKIQTVVYGETPLSLYYRRVLPRVEDVDEGRENYEKEPSEISNAITQVISESEDDKLTVHSTQTFDVMPVKGHAQSKISATLRMASRVSKQKQKFNKHPINKKHGVLQEALWPPLDCSRILDMRQINTIRKDFAIQLYSQQMQNRERKWNSCFSQTSKRRNIYVKCEPK